MSDTALIAAKRARHTNLTNTAPVNYAERLFKLERLKQKRELLYVYISSIEADKGWLHSDPMKKATAPLHEEIAGINAQISKLLEDE